jgi:phospholipid/cholesterol/gamma-HCH transport system permease protein
LEREFAGTRLLVRFSGDWLKDQDRPPISSFEDGLGEADEIVFSFDGLGGWDSTLPVFFDKCLGICRKLEIRADSSGASRGLRKLLDLSRSSTVQEEKAAEPGQHETILTRIGLWTIGTSGGAVQSLGFIGQSALSLGRLLSGRSSMRWRDCWAILQSCGAEALPIVTLVSFLTGLTMAFVGGVQLEKFSAQIYMADLVGLAMVREMGALMVAIVMAGRTGAAFAAELGNMKVSEEIDSLKTFGISPFDFLVLPRVLALFIMIPLLTLYADLVGIIGGMVVGVGVLEFSIDHYLAQTEMAITSMWEVYSGMLKSLAFGAIIGLVGCYKGIGCGSSSAAVGRAVTSAVVTSITLVVVTDAIFEVIFSFLGLR